MPTNKPGRPYAQGITEALLQAAERVMVDGGYSSLTIDALAAEVGTTRPTFYRRFPSVAHLAFAVIKNRFGTGAPTDTGSLGEDLLVLQREEIAMFATPLLRKNLPGLLEAIRTDSELREIYETEFVQPRRANVGRILAAAAGRGEIGAEAVDDEYVCDLLVGPILSRALLPVGAPLDDRLARQTVETVLRTMAARDAAGA
jgi:AcrR family transcriptional regulator